MTTYELLNILEEQFPGWNRDGIRGLLRYIDIAQKALCMVPAEQLLIYDTATGRLPLLPTTAGMFQYFASADASFIDQVLIECDVATPIQDYGRAVKRIERVSIAGIDYIRVPYIRTWPATDTTNAKLLFTTDPGTCPAIYRLRSYKRPASLDSDSIELTIPPPYDELYLLPAAAKLVEGANHGNYIEARAMVVKEFMPLMWQAFNMGEQGQDDEPEDRGF